MKKITIPITKSARQFGYIIWTRKLANQIDAILGGASKVHLYFQGIDLGEKRVDRKYRRISVGYRWTRRLPDDANIYILSMPDKTEKKLFVETA